MLVLGICTFAQRLTGAFIFPLRQTGVIRFSTGPDRELVLPLASTGGEGLIVAWLSSAVNLSMALVLGVGLAAAHHKQSWSHPVLATWWAFTALETAVRPAMIWLLQDADPRWVLLASGDLPIDDICFSLPISAAWLGLLGAWLLTNGRRS